MGIDNAKNRNISADVVDGYVSRLGELIKFKPVSIFIIIGINGLFNLHYQNGISSPRLSIKNFLKNTTLLHESLPRTQIYFQTLSPLGKDFINKHANIVNSAIGSVNQMGLII